MYSVIAPLPFEPASCEPDDFSAVLGFVLSADEVFDLYNNAPCGYHSLNAEGRFLRVNNTLLHWLGYTRDAVVGRMHFAQLVAPESREAFANSFADLHRHGAVGSVELRLHRADGSSLDVRMDAVSLPGDAGRRGTARFTLFDITCQKAMEAALRERERFCAHVLCAIPAFVCVYDREKQRPVVSNREAATHLGYTPRQIADMGDALFERIVHPDDLPAVAAHIAGADKNHPSRSITYRVRRADGRYDRFLSRDTVFVRGGNDEAGAQCLSVAHVVSDTAF